jgi:lipoate-protein ligase A
MPWRILSDAVSAKGASGPRNMAIDEAVLAAVEAGEAPPTLRVYGWAPPCISLGHSQDPFRELALDAVAARGYGVVKRATGGRAVLHIDELTYSIIARADSAPWCATQALSYRFISQAVAQALSAAGFGVALDRGSPVEKPRALRAMTPCFSSTARSEVVFGDRKVVGSAQRRTRDAFLQHGSILVSRRHRDIVDCLRLAPEKRAGYLEVLDGNSVSLDIAWDRPVRWEDLASGFAERLAAALGMAAAPSGLSGREEGEAMRSEAEKLACMRAWLEAGAAGRSALRPEGARAC